MYANNLDAKFRLILETWLNSCKISTSVNNKMNGDYLQFSDFSFRFLVLCMLSLCRTVVTFKTNRAMLMLLVAPEVSLLWQLPLWERLRMTQLWLWLINSIVCIYPAFLWAKTGNVVTWGIHTQSNTHVVWTSVSTSQMNVEPLWIRQYWHNSTGPMSLCVKCSRLDRVTSGRLVRWLYVLQLWFVALALWRWSAALPEGPDPQRSMFQLSEQSMVGHGLHTIRARGLLSLLGF